ncbi:MAG: hypothetical protein GKS04_00225 [Candidatus Mycalebacterium zealandia]|nr:MAG: hypothetical protein GKS04_00225 [Candidatus Mycalebacterium zealandia]
MAKSKKPVPPEPEFAALTVERFEKNNRKLKAGEKRLLLQIASHSRFLARAAIRDPETVSFPFSNKARTKNAIDKKLAAISRKIGNTDDFFEELRRFKYRRLAQIIYEDINGADFTKTMEELSDLAEAVVEASVLRLAPETGADKAGKFCVLGMGKLAGRQLNLSSDIDLVYVYEDNGNARPFIDLSHRLTAEIGANTENGFLYRVDLGLRPGGMKGSVTTHIEGVLEHYFYRGETWEKLALMKAREIAGDKALGAELLGKLEPFIYDNTSYDLIEDMSEMKRRLEGITKKRDVKLADGGIRGIEFFAQTLQILNGANKNLRDSNTLSALKKLLKRKTIPQEVADALRENYLFLRKVEHNIQLDEETQTHSVPESPEKLSRLAVMMGFKSTAKFEETLDDVMNETRKICGELFKRPSGEEKPMEDWEKEAVRITEFLTSGDVERPEALRSLASLGFKNPEEALDIITDLETHEMAGGDFRARGLSKKMLRMLFKQSFACGDLNLALTNLKRLMANQEWKMSIYPLISAAPQTLEIFMKIMGCENPISSFLIHNPYYMGSVALKGKSALGEKSGILRSLEELTAKLDSDEEKLDTLCHFKYMETLKLCVSEFEENIDFQRTGKYLSLLAEVMIEAVLKIAKRHTGNTGTRGVSTAKTCVLGMGKLGGGELSYSSDLDIIVIHDGPQTERYVKLAQKLIGFLSLTDRHGQIYEIDTSLRPSGNAGTLVTSFEEFKQYNRSQTGARLWERQALIKASHCAGGKSFGNKVINEIEKCVYEAPLEKDYHKKIAHLRGRMEKELAHESGNYFNFKTGRGGMVDVEFLVQSMQLKHGGKHLELRTPNTLEALDRLISLEIVGEKEGKSLRDSYIFLGTISILQGIFRKKHGNRIGPDDFERLAREFEQFPTVDKLRKEYISKTRTTRKIYKRFFN